MTFLRDEIPGAPINAYDIPADDEVRCSMTSILSTLGAHQFVSAADREGAGQ